MLVNLLQEKTKKAIQDRQNDIGRLANELFEQFKKRALSAAGERKSTICFFLEDNLLDSKKLFEDRLQKEGLKWKERPRPGSIRGWEYTISWEPTDHVS